MGEPTVLVVSGKVLDKPGLKAAIGDAVLRGFAVEAKVTTPEVSAYALTLEAMRAGARRIVAIGGDGTVHEVLAAILTTSGPRPELGFVPAGTANDFATLLGELKDPFEVWLERALAGEAKTIDAGAANGVPFANMVTLGPSAQISDETSKDLKALLGKAAYFVTAVGAAPRLEAIDAAVFGPAGELWSGRAAAISIANGRQVGGGLKVAPDADLNDGLLDVLIVPEMSLAALGIVAGSALFGQLDGIQGIERFRLPWVEVRGADRFACSLDGEVADVQTVRCEVIRDAVGLVGFAG